MTFRKLLGASALALTMSLSACGDKAAVPEAPKAAKLGSFGVDLANIDQSVAPGENFF